MAVSQEGVNLAHALAIQTIMQVIDDALPGRMLPSLDKTACSISDCLEQNPDSEKDRDALGIIATFTEILRERKTAEAAAPTATAPGSAYISVKLEAGSGEQ